MELKGKKVTVFGFGRTGQALAKVLSSRGARVFVTEKNPKENFDPSLFNIPNVEFEFGAHSLKAIEGSNLIVMSPGIHLDIDVLDAARSKSIPIVSEIEYASWSIKKPIIAITGTNGKTTTTTLIGRILKDAGYKVEVAGNIGKPLALIDDKGLDYIVLEVSSYQLECIDKFRPYIAVILNLTEDHLERHHSMDGYAAAKAQIFKNQNKDDFLIYNADDPLVEKMSKKAGSYAIPFSRKKYDIKGAFIKRGEIIVKFEAFDNKIIQVGDIKLKGLHNLENCLAAVLCGLICGVPNDSINKTLRSFKGVEHRIEFVAVKGGVTFINDSKGTNVDSTVVAIETVVSQHDSKIVLIAGGRDKGGDLKPLVDKVRDHVGRVILLGESKERFSDALKKAGYSDFEIVDSFEESIKRAFEAAQPEGVVLLSPACASFDMFANFEERGRVFKEIVSRL